MSHLSSKMSRPLLSNSWTSADVVKISWRRSSGLKDSQCCMRWTQMTHFLYVLTRRLSQNLAVWSGEHTWWLMPLVIRSPITNTSSKLQDKYIQLQQFRAITALSWRGRGGWLGTSCIASFHKDTVCKATHGQWPLAQCLSCCLCECDAANWLMCDWYISHGLASFLQEWWLLVTRKAKYMKKQTPTHACTHVIQDKTL